MRPLYPNDPPEENETMTEEVNTESGGWVTDLTVTNDYTLVSNYENGFTQNNNYLFYNSHQEDINKSYLNYLEKAEHFKLCIQSGKETLIEAAENSLIARNENNGVNNLKFIKNKTLIIWGDKDKSYNLKQVKTLEKNISNSSLVIFEGCAHNVHLEKIEEFNRTVFNFINDNLNE